MADSPAPTPSSPAKSRRWFLGVLTCVGLVAFLWLGGRFLAFYLEPRQAYYRALNRLEPWILPNHSKPHLSKEHRTIHEIKRALVTAGGNSRFTREVDGKLHYLNKELHALADEFERTNGAAMKTAAGAWQIVQRLEAMAPDLKEYSWITMLDQLAEEGVIEPRPARKTGAVER